MSDRRQGATPVGPPGGRPPDGAGDHLNDDLCMEIVAGLVPRDARALLLAHADACPACEARLMLVAGDWESIRSRTDAQARAGGSGEAASSPMALQRPGRGVFRGSRILLPLALVAGLLVLILVRAPRPARLDEGPAYWLPATGELLKLRGAHSGEADSAFWSGLDAYEAHDFRKATTLLEASRAEGGLGDLRRLHLASLHVNTGGAAATLSLLKQIDMESLPMPWRDEAHWMEYLALVRLGHAAEAAERLDRMAQWPGRIGDLARERKSR